VRGRGKAWNGLANTAGQVLQAKEAEKENLKV